MLNGWSRGSLSNVKLGFKKDGTLTTVDFENYMEVGSGGDKWPIKNSLLATGTTLYAHNCKHMRGSSGTFIPTDSCPAAGKATVLRRVIMQWKRPWIWLLRSLE